MNRRFPFALVGLLLSCAGPMSIDTSSTESESFSVSESVSTSDPYVPYCVQTQEFEGEAYLGSLRFSKLEDGTWEVTCPYPEGYDGASVRIPDEVNGIPVTSVGPYAFSQATNLRQIALPPSLRAIKNNAFYYTNLDSVILPEGLLEIGTNAFYRTKIPAISIPNSVHKIGSLFNYPAEVSFASGSPFYIQDGFIYTDAGKTLVQCVNPDLSPESFDIGPEVKAVGDFAFLGMENLKEVSIGPNVKTIGKGAFKFCTSLEAVIFPSSLREIGDQAFYGCNSLGQVSLNEGLERIGNQAFTRVEEITIPASVHEFCPRLYLSPDKIYGKTVLSPANPYFETSGPYVIRKEDRRLVGIKEPLGDGDVFLPEGIEIIGEWALSRCHILGNLAFPSSLKRVGAHAFEHAIIEGTTNGLPEGLTYIGESAFEGAHLWQDTNLLNRLPSTVEEIGNRAFSNYETMPPANETNCRFLPESVQAIGDYAFAGTVTPKSVLLPSALQDLGLCTFADCGYLQSFEVDPDHPRFSVRDGVVYDKTFSSIVTCPAGKTGSLTLPSTIKRIGSRALGGQTGNLESLTIPASVEYIGESAFSATGRPYRSSTVIAFEEGSRIRYIGEKAFYWVHQAHFPERFLPEGLEFLGPMAFGRNTAPETFRLPASLNYVGSGAFAEFHTLGHKNTITIRYAGTRAEWEAVDKGHAFFDDSDVTSLRASDGKILDIPQDDPQTSSSSFPMPPGF